MIVIVIVICDLIFSILRNPLPPRIHASISYKKRLFLVSLSLLSQNDSTFLSTTTMPRPTPNYHNPNSARRRSRSTRPRVADMARLSEIQCNANNCSVLFEQCCPQCGDNFCHHHFDGHTCMQSTSTAPVHIEAITTANWTTASTDTSTPVRGSYRSYTYLQKDIAKYLSSHLGTKRASEMLNIHSSLISRWKQRAQYQPDTNAQSPPSGTASARPLDEICRLRPEERTDEENKRVFQFLGHTDHETFTSTEEYQVSMGDQLPAQAVVENPYPTLDDNDDFWTQGFDGSLTRQNELDQLYSQQYLSAVVDSDLPEELKAPIEAAINIALQQDGECRSQNTNAAWDPKKRAFAVCIYYQFPI